MSRVYNINLEHGERWWYAHVAEFVGCFTRGETREAVLSKLPETIKHYADRLREGEMLVDVSDLRVLEEVDNVPMLGEAGGATALFKTDLKHVSEQELRAFFALMSLNREELLNLVSLLSEKQMAIEAIPGKWSIKQTLNHVINAEEWYISRLGVKYQRVYEACLREKRVPRTKHTPIERLKLIRPCIIKSLEAAYQDGLDAPFKRRAYTQYPGELWTLRKVFRRFIEHEVEHINTINKTLEALKTPLSYKP